MNIFLQDILLKFLLPTILLLFAIFLFFKHQYRYWSRLGIPYIKPKIPWGNFKALLFDEKSLSKLAQNLYQELKENGYKHGGLYFLNTPIYMPIDPEYIKNILLTDFDYFNERGVYYDEKIDPLSPHLFNLPHNQWKRIRTKISPTFTTGKLKMMFPTMVKCSEGLVSAIGNQKVIDINDISIRFTLDIIGSCAFGIESNSLNNSNAEFKKIAHKVTNPPYWNAIKFFISLLNPKLAKYVHYNFYKKEIVEFFFSLVQQTMDYRQKNNIQRNDFMQLMINLKNEDEKLPESEKLLDLNTITAQVYVFFAAGYETSSMTINLCLFELSQNSAIQERARSEIRRILKGNNNELTYEGLMAMTYLEKVVQETMRKYPSLGYLNRMCTKDYRIPGTDIILEKGTMVLISTLGLHRDPDYYENPDTYNPERFNDENKSSINQYTYLPFGEGHRICIGARFGQLQTKICLAVLLANFKYTLNERTRVPLEYNTNSFVDSLKHLIYLNVEKVVD